MLMGRGYPWNSKNISSIKLVLFCSPLLLQSCRSIYACSERMQFSSCESGVTCILSRTQECRCLFFGTGGEVQMALLQLFLVNQDEHMLDEQGAEILSLDQGKGATANPSEKSAGTSWKLRSTSNFIIFYVSFLPD